MFEEDCTRVGVKDTDLAFIKKHREITNTFYFN